MVHSVVILYDILKCRDNFESKEAQLCILTLFETYAQRILVLKFSEHFENNESKWCILSLFYTIF